MYGVNCVEKCGNCKNNESCDIVNGTCPNGCAAGYNGTVCKDGKFLSATIKINSTKMMWHEMDNSVKEFLRQRLQNCFLVSRSHCYHTEYAIVLQQR